ncbi:MAG TPA: hypothetical protein VF658_11610 [Pyrinomonadaceae bacterium]|jgi:hypothetical protein
MKKSASLKFLLALLLLCVSSLAVAQESVNCDQLRTKIAQLEELDLNAMSPSVQQLYKESLLKLYTQFSNCLQRDISVTDSMQRAVVGTDAAQGVEDKLNALKKEKADTDGKIILMRTALNLPDEAPTAAAASAPQTAPTTGNDGGALRPLRAARPLASSAMVSPAPTTSAAVPAPQIAANCDPVATYDAPEILKDIVAKAAKDTVRTGDPTRPKRAGIEMVLYTVFDAASPTSSQAVRQLAAYQYLGETARTDKQLGASTKSDGAVSAIEKPGFARLLGFAIEHGGITKKNDGTNLTLSTSLYSFYAMNGGDTAATYDRAGFLNRIGVSATFALADKNDELGNARRQNLSEWSIRARLFGDRSTRSPEFQKFWDTEIRPLIADRLQTIGKAVEGLATGDDQINAYDDLESNALDTLPDLIRGRMACPDYVAATTDAKEKIISDLILSHMKTTVLDTVKGGQFQLSADEISRIEVKYLPSLKVALDNLDLARTLLEKKIDDLKKSPLGTFAYINHRTPTGSDYSEAKFLFEQDKSFLRPLKLNANFGLTFYHRPDSALQQEKLRDVTAALAFEGSSRSPFTEGENLSKITYTFVGSYQRMFENRRRPNRKPDLASAQFLLEIPFVRGFSVPLSLTYSNATEEERKKNVRFNFGMRLDTDKLFDLLRATSER